MPTATSLEAIEPRLRDLLGLVDDSEQTRRILDYVIAYAASVRRGAVQLKDKSMVALQLTKEIAAPRKRILAVVDDSGRTSRVLDYAIGYAANVGPTEVVILDVEPGPSIRPAFPHAIARRRPAAYVSTRAIRAASRRLNHLGIIHKTRAEIGDPASTIIRCANEEGCDMIVLNDPNPENNADELPRQMSNSVGSVSQRVAQLADIPVVVTR